MAKNSQILAKSSFPDSQLTDKPGPEKKILRIHNTSYLNLRQDLLQQYMYMK
jgi:hypothetical protein